MIQRAQSVYLLLVASISFLILFANPRYASFEEGDTKSQELRFTTTVIYKGDKVNPVAKWINIFILVLVGIGSAINIFMFKKKEQQKKICIYLTLLEALLLIIMVMDFNAARNLYEKSSTYPGVWSVLPLVLIVLSFMSWRGVRKDEQLLKSMDRIR